MSASSSEKVVRLLLDDYERQGGHLTKVQVERLQEKRGLTIDECVEVYRLLAEMGVQVSGAEPAPVREAPPEAIAPSVDAPRSRREPDEDALGALLRHTPRSVLTSLEELELGRKMALGRRAVEQAPESSWTDTHRAVVAEANAARSRLIEANVRLVVHNARAYAGTCDLPLEDLVQEGILGLVRAVEKFDHTLGYKFSTYASWWIRQSITRAIADRGSLIRLPVHVQEKLYKLKKALRAMHRANPDREPTLKELSDELDLPVDQVQFLLDIRVLSPTSLDAPLGDAEGTTLGEVLVSKLEGPEQHLERVAREDAVDWVLAGLAPRERDVLLLRFGLAAECGGEPSTLEQVGQLFGVTRERIRQIEAKAIRKVQSRVKRDGRSPLRDLGFTFVKKQPAAVAEESPS